MAVSKYFAVGRTAVLSQRLLSAETFNRLADCQDVEQAMRFLRETGYDSGVFGDYEEMLRKQLSDAVSYLKDMTSEQRVTDAFVLCYDYINAKILMKSKYMRQDNLGMCYNCGLIDKDKLWQWISNDNYKDLPTFMAKALAEIDWLFAEGKRSPALIDMLLDVAMYRDVRQHIKGNVPQSVKQYFFLEVDCNNIMALYRAKRADIPADVVAKTLVDGYTFDVEELREIYETDIAQMTEWLSKTDYRWLAEYCQQCVDEGKDFGKCYREIDKKKHELMSQGKNNISVEPVICYYLSKVTETENIRTVLICIKNGVDKSAIKERIKELYV